MSLGHKGFGRPWGGELEPWRTVLQKCEGLALWREIFRREVSGLEPLVLLVLRCMDGGQKRLQTMHPATNLGISYT